MDELFFWTDRQDAYPTVVEAHLDNRKRGVRAALLGLVSDSLLAGIKFVAGIVGHSYALIADAVEATLALPSTQKYEESA